MKEFTIKYKTGGSTTVRNIINDLVEGDAYYIMTINTDVGIATTLKTVDGFFVDERNTQSCTITPW